MGPCGAGEGLMDRGGTTSVHRDGKEERGGGGCGG